MPLYEFRCPSCGPFDVQRAMHEGAETTPCPHCARPAGRRYTTAASPEHPARGASRADRARWDRARGGEPVVTGPPSGRRLPPGRRHRH